MARADELRHVVASGRHSRRSHLEIHWISNDIGHPRLGVIAPRLGRPAVARNRLRRRVREIWRRDVQQRIPAWDVVIRTVAESYVASFGELRGNLLGWCEAATKGHGDAAC